MSKETSRKALRRLAAAAAALMVIFTCAAACLSGCGKGAGTDGTESAGATEAMAATEAVISAEPYGAFGPAATVEAPDTEEEAAEGVEYVPFLRDGGYASLVTSDDAEISETTDEQKEAADGVLSHYAASPGEMAELGCAAIDAALEDGSGIGIEEAFSVYAEPEGDSGEVTLTSGLIADGGIYIVVTESAGADGQYDVTFAVGSANTIVIKTGGAGPISAALVTITH